MRFERGNNLAQLKISNQSNILRMIYYDGPICRGEIAGRLGLTLPTITQAVNAMIADGLVENAASRRGEKGGRRAHPLTVRPQARHFVGIETTGRHRAVCVCDYRGDVLHVLQDWDVCPDYWESLKRTVAVVRRCLSEAGFSLEDISGIGICVPGLVDCQEGVLRAHPRTNWKDKAVEKDFAALSGYAGPIALENNACARAAGAQMFHRDLLGNAGNFAYLYVDQGMACPLYLSSSRFTGSVVGAGEVGHMVIVPNGRLCSCGNHGCLEAYSSDSAILRYAAEALSQGQAPGLRALCRDPAVPTTAELLEAQRQEEPDVCRIVDEAVRALGVGVANIINFTCPEAMLIDCKLFQSQKNRQRLMEVTYSNIYNVAYTGTRFAFVEPDELRGARSAAAVAIDADLSRYAAGGGKV